MLINQTKEKLYELRLKGMAAALEEQLNNAQLSSLSFEERLSFLVDKELILRENRRLSRLTREASLRQNNACLEDIDYASSRGIDKSQINNLLSFNWLDKAHNLIITGSTGSGKTYLACAFANAGLRRGHRVSYFRINKLFEQLKIAKADGSYLKLMDKISKASLLILDDWGLTPLSDVERKDFLEIIEERHSRSSTLITSQLPLEDWYESIGNPTLADAILDRLIHNAYKIELKGGSMRKKHNNLTTNRPL